LESYEKLFALGFTSVRNSNLLNQIFIRVLQANLGVGPPTC